MFDILVDGELVGVEENMYYDFYPVGKYQCGCCKDMYKFDHEYHAFFDYNNNYIVCPRCDGAAPNQFPLMFCRIDGRLELESSDHVVVIKATVDTDKKHEVMKNAQNIAQGLNKHWFNGKCTTDVWRETLARRVIRSFRKHRVNSLRRKVVFVLHGCTYLNLSASKQIASHIK
jgi:uncharacterized protein CbrC (UPF0167 family)